MKYTTIDRILNKLFRDYGDNIPEGDIIEWAGEALEFIGAVRQYEEAVAFMEVANHQVSLPMGFHAVVQIARNNRWTCDNKLEAGICPAEVVLPMPNPLAVGPADVPVPLDCRGMPITDYDLAYYRPYFDLKHEYGTWVGSGIYRDSFSPVRLSTSKLYDSIVCKVRENSKHVNCRDEYTIIKGQVLRFSFQEGQVALSYLRQVLDEETGYPMVPDDISFTTAITTYVIYKAETKLFYLRRQGSQATMQKAESDWHWYCKQANNKAKMPQGIDEYQNLMQQSMYLIPRLGEYNTFFGKLGHAENIGLNNRSSHFRGQ